MDGTSRRSFITGASAALLAGGVGSRSTAAATTASDVGRARGDATLRIGLVGCGGRGTGAAAQALSTSGPVELVAMADAFEDRLEHCHAQLAEMGENGSFDHGRRLQAPAENRYVGFDAYRKVIDSGVDVVVLATPPGFRPEHFEYAVEQGKHVFMEKPVAVDAPGVRRVLAAARAAREKNLKVGVGLQRHHSGMYNETIRRIHDGAIGDVVALRVYWNSSGVWVRARQPGQTEMEYQMRNWYYFNWLCGDHIVEQHIHNIDVGNWVKGGHPVAAQGQGGRQWRNGPDHGEIFDHHFVEYTYDDGAVMLSQCRHIRNCWDQVAEFAHGSKGRASLASGRIEAPGGWSHREPEDEDNPYQVEHDRLFEAIREGRPFDEAKNGAIATMTAVMGRMATYSGRKITWDEALASDVSLEPAVLAWDADPPTLPDDEGRYAVAAPGVTRV